MLAWLFAAAAFVLSAAAAQEAPATPAQWRAAARADLEALRSIIAADTPIVVDEENPRLRAWYDRGYRQAQGRLARVRDRAGYFYTLAAYVNGFGDPHLALSQTATNPIARWPGFIASADGENTIVMVSEAGAPPEGARILNCDGRSLATLRTQTVFAYTLNPALARDQRAAHARLFLDRGNPFAPPPRRCLIEHQGARQSWTLAWRDIPEDFWQRYTIATNGPGAEFGVTLLDGGVAWIGVPTFGNDAAPQMEALIAEIEPRAEAMRAGRAIVIDVRGNGGGNSGWADRIASAVFGADVVAAVAQPSTPTATDWRASAANIAYLDDFAPQLLAQFGADSEIGRWITRALDQMRAAHARGDPLWRQRDDGGDGPIGPGGGYTRARPQGVSPFPARVYLLSNGTCASSCLNFADTVLHIPGVQLIGSDTSADGLLMEVRDQVLPSGQARLTLPMKISRGRARGAMEAYVADIPYTGVWSDEAVRAWVLETVTAQ